MKENQLQLYSLQGVMFGTGMRTLVLEKVPVYTSFFQHHIEKMPLAYKPMAFFRCGSASWTVFDPTSREPLK